MGGPLTDLHRVDEDGLRPPELQVRDAGMTSGTGWLFRHLNLVIPPGGWLTVVGPSGSGKTTLLRLLAGLFAPAEGAIQIGGAAWSSMSSEERVSLRRKFGYVQQQPGLLHASVVENVAIPLRWRGLMRDEATRRARASLEAAGLLDSAMKGALSLSGGERQRLAFARAMAVRPEVLLLDEFTNHQDPRRGDILESIVAERMRQGGTVVLVAHDLRQIDRLRTDARCDPTILVLVDGGSRAAAWELMPQLLEGDDPVSAFVQRLVQGDRVHVSEPAAGPTL